MYKLFTILIFIISGSNLCFSQTNDNSNMDSQYDSLLAQKLGADDYGMKQYVMAFLKSGKVKLEDKQESEKLQMEHMKNIGRMAEEGKLILAGPFMDNQEIRGIYIFDVRSVDEAKELTATDPAIKAGILEMELHRWYGPAALMEIIPISKKVQKKSFSD